MIYKVLDAEKDVVEQGFTEHSYDFVIASLVIHATKDLSHTVRNVRRLLKPGGYLAMLELTNLRPIRVSFCMSGLEGWWLGSAENGRQYSPCVDANQWNSILRENGFSSIDAITPDLDPEPWPFNIIVAQAVDDRVMSLRNPLSTSSLPEPASQELLILGGEKLQTSLLADKVDRLLSPWFGRVNRVARIEDIVDIPLRPRATVLSLADLDRAVFKDISLDRLEGLKKVLENSTNVLWVTRNARTDPYTNMTIGFG
jgi:hybrid polyketide synthase / nonribosomal peptide synthetase ACE1